MIQFNQLQQINYMEKVLTELQQRNPWKEFMRKSCRTNKLNVDIVSYFTPLRIRAAYLKFENIYEKKRESRQQRWLENELKAFYWICVALSAISTLGVSQFGETQWEILSQIFYSKNRVNLEYQARKLVEDGHQTQIWSLREDQLLVSIVSKNHDKSNKWNQFGRRLYEESEKQYLRTGKQCRERWLNHLDPSKKHGDWSHQQDREIASLCMSIGKKWSKIAKELGNNRTEHMIKNRFKTIYSRQKKQHPTIKSEEKLLALYIKGHFQPQATVHEEQRLFGDQIKSENRSNSDLLKDLPIEEELLSIDINDFVMQEPVKEKLNDVNPNHTVELPQNCSPWYANIPITPNYSPFYMNYQGSFSSLDSKFVNQFYCTRNANEGSHDHF